MLTKGVFMTNNKRNIIVSAGLLSVVLNFLLFIFKYRIGVLNQSIAIKADAWHTLSDSFSSLVLIGGAFIAGRAENKRHPYGYGRFEEITSIVIGVLLIMVSFNFVRDSIVNLIEGRDISYSLSSYVIMLVTIAVKEGLAQVSIRLGKKKNSLSLVADGWHHRSDAISSLIVLAGFFLAPLVPGIDSILGILVAAMILWAAIGIIRKASVRILGEACSEDIVDGIISLSNNVTPSITDLHDFHLHKYGDYEEIVFHCRLPGTTELERAHDLATRLESAVEQKFGMTATVHVETQPAVNSN